MSELNFGTIEGTHCVNLFELRSGTTLNIKQANIGHVHGTAFDVGTDSKINVGRFTFDRIDGDFVKERRELPEQVKGSDFWTNLNTTVSVVGIVAALAGRT
ncbi:MAG: hypothetical protein ACFB03_07250 [Paracoccaceae bacterium]